VSGNIFTSPKAIADLLKLTINAPRRAAPRPASTDHGLTIDVMAKLDAKLGQRSRSQRRPHQDRPQ
jgi:hypothetical protein